MAEISPFSCFRPARALVQRFVQRPTDYSPEERATNLEKLLSKSVYSISQPELFGKTFEDGKAKFADLFKNGFIFPEINKAIYIYRITSDGKPQLGLVAQQQLSDFTNGTIKLHEKTRKASRDYLYERFTQLRLNFTPIFSFYKDEYSLLETLEGLIKDKVADLDFTTVDGREHKVWKMDVIEEVEYIVNRFSSVETVYLADGHHRLSMLKHVYDELGIAEAEQRVTNILFPAQALGILSFARAIRDIEPDKMDQLSTFLDQKCTKQKPTNEVVPGSYDFYFNNKWHRYTLKDSIKVNYSDSGIDYLLALNKEILEPFFEIIDQESDDRILFFKDMAGVDELEQTALRVQANLVIRLHPISVNDIIHAADQEITLPPKSTLFEPKPRAGVFITQI